MPLGKPDVINPSYTQHTWSSVENISVFLLDLFCYKTELSFFSDFLIFFSVTGAGEVGRSWYNLDKILKCPGKFCGLVGKACWQPLLKVEALGLRGEETLQPVCEDLGSCTPFPGCQHVARDPSVLSLWPAVRFCSSSLDTRLRHSSLALVLRYTDCWS